MGACNSQSRHTQPVVAGGDEEGKEQKFDPEFICPATGAACSRAVGGAGMFGDPSKSINDATARLLEQATLEGALGVKTKDLNTILDCEHQRYTDPAVLSEGVKKGTILLVKADYFEERYDAKQPIQCYQDIRDTEGVDYFVQELKPESIFSVKFQGKNIAPVWTKEPHFKCTDKTEYVVAVISYPWLSKEHPDPKMHWLRLIAGFCRCFRDFWGDEEKLKCGTSHGIKSRWSTKKLLLWMDYTSMPQRGQGEKDRRNEKELKLFKRCLTETVNLMYTHQMVQVWMLTDVPKDAANNIPYHTRGWCMFEKNISNLISDCVLDLGEIEGGASSLWDDEEDGPTIQKSEGGQTLKRQSSAFRRSSSSMFHDEEKEGVRYLDMFAGCQKKSSSPPMSPQDFAADINLESTKFTNGKTDKPFVIDKYRATVVEVIRYAQELNFAGRGWFVQDAPMIGPVLSAGVDLVRLDLAHNFCADEVTTPRRHTHRNSLHEGIGAPMKPIACPNLKVLSLSSCTGVTDAIVLAFVENCPALEEIDLTKCSLITDEVLLAMGKKCRRLREVTLFENFQLTDRGKKELRKKGVRGFA